MKEISLEVERLFRLVRFGMGFEKFFFFRVVWVEFWGYFFVD